MRYMLDTDICIYALNGKSPKLDSRLAKTSIGQTGISTAVLAELEYGIAESKQRNENRKRLLEFLEIVPVIDWPYFAARAYGKLRHQLQCSGKPIGQMDLMIAAHAYAEKCTLITNNTRDFKRVKGLKIDNWLR